MGNISGFGTKITMVATFSFPTGFNITALTKEADPLDAAVIQIGDSIQDVNGGMSPFSISVPIDVKITVVANNDDADNLGILFNNNRPESGKLPVNDVLTMAIVYVDGSSYTLGEGMVISGPPIKSMASDSHLKSLEYNFRFNKLIQTSN